MDDCIFCKIVAGKAKSWKVHETQNVLAFLDVNPVNEFHTLVVPKKHYENIFDVPEQDLQEVMAVVKEIVSVFQRKVGIENVQIVNSSGADAQQDVFHFHFHIVPRRKEDLQDIKWTTHPEWVERFDQLLADLT